MGGGAADSLLEISWFYAGLFFAYIAFTMFAVLNIVTGIFVDAAMQTALYERDLISDKQSRLEEASAEHLRELFFEMDADDSGVMTLDHFIADLQDEQVSSYLNALKINTEDANQLFRLLDTDNSGEIFIDEFVEGCMKLKGEAKSMDLHVMMCDHRRMLCSFYEFVNSVEERLREIADLPMVVRGILCSRQAMPGAHPTWK